MHYDPMMIRRFMDFQKKVDDRIHWIQGFSYTPDTGLVRDVSLPASEQKLWEGKYENFHDMLGYHRAYVALQMYNEFFEELKSAS